MTLKQYLTLMSLGTAICWTAWTFIIFNIDPTGSDILGFIFFYVSLFLSLLGTISVIGFWIRQRMTKQDEVVFRHVKKTFNQAVMISSFIILVLILQQNSFLNWWNTIVLFILFGLVEAIVFSNRKYNNRDYV